MRLINADALREFVKEKCSYCTSFIGKEDVLSWIDKAPTIVEVDELDMLEQMYAKRSVKTTTKNDKTI